MACFAFNGDKMEATLDYQRDVKLFTAVLSNGLSFSHADPIKLAQLLLDAGVEPEDVKWSVWSLENKFTDIMRAVQNKNDGWARMSAFELKMRM